MRVKVVALAALAMAASCTHRAVTLNAPVGGAHTAVSANMGRQISNAVDMGDGDVEVRSLRARLSAEPENIDVRMRLAARYEAMGFPEIALEHYRLAAERFPNDAAVMVRLARQLRSQGSGEEGARILERYAHAHADATAEVHAWLGILLDEAGGLAAGERAHRKAIEVAGEVGADRRAYLHNNLGQNLLLQGRHAEAAEEFRAALRADRRSAIARNNLGVALAALPEGQSSEAVLHWKSIADAATAHNNLAVVLIEQGRYTEARQQLSLALGYKPDSAAALRNLALVGELDGQAAVMDAKRAPSLWRRFATVMLGVEEKRAERPADEGPLKPGDRASSRD
jgi:tetratricopeptide (TPR) repeat protein